MTIFQHCLNFAQKSIESFLWLKINEENYKREVINVAKHNKKYDADQKNKRGQTQKQHDIEFGNEFGSTQANKYNEGGAQSGTKK